MRYFVFVFLLFFGLFANGQTLQIIPIDNTVTPQDFGYVPNENPEQFENDATAYIQAALDSDYSVKIPPGFYYITKPLKVYRSKHIEMVGRYDRARVKYSKGLPYRSDKTVIYTNQAIDFFHIYEGGTTINGGTLIAENVRRPRDVAFFRIFYRDNLNQYSRIENVSMWGGINEMRGDGLGYYGITFDSETPFENPSYPKRNNNGELHFLHVNVYARYLHTVYHQDATKSNSRNTIHVDEFGCKRAVYLGRGGGCKITGTGHTAYVLTKNERDFAKITLNSGSNDVDFTHVEITTGEPIKGNYPNVRAYEVNARNNWMSGGGRNFWNVYRPSMAIGSERFMNWDFLLNLYKPPKK